MNRKARSKLLGAAKKMPPLKHKVGEEYDVRKSEAVKWLVQQPDILNYIWNQVKQTDTTYDPSTGTWKGVDYHD